MKLEKKEYNPVLQAIVSRLFNLETTIKKINNNKDKIDENTFNIINRDFKEEKDSLVSVKRKLEQLIYNEANRNKRLISKEDLQ